jgi:hypothetical protein
MVLSNQMQDSRAQFPSPLVGEGGVRGSVSGAHAGRGVWRNFNFIPLPPSLGYRLREGTLSHRGRGEERLWRVSELQLQFA